MDETKHAGKVQQVKSEGRRLKSVNEKFEKYVEGKHLIQKALAGENVGNKKIKFEDNSDEEQGKKGDEYQENFIFGDSSGESENELDSRFEGNKSEKFIKLQSKYANDARFKLDDRFQDESEHDSEDKEKSDTEVQLNVLESVLGYPIKKKEKKIPKSFNSMLRFDPLKHGKIEEEVLKKRKRENGDTEETETQMDAETPELDEKVAKVIKTKFYEVKKDFKEILKKEEKASFSLLDTFGPVEDKAEVKAKGATDKSEVTIKSLRRMGTFNPFKYDSSDTEEEDDRENVFGHVKEQESEYRRTTGEPFFFPQDDQRLLDGLSFSVGTVAKPTDLAKFNQRRRELKGFVKNKVQNTNMRQANVQKKILQKKRHFFALKNKRGKKR